MINDPRHATIRALFLDVDGTLVGADEEISAGVRLAVQQAASRGCAVVLCTGRTRFRTEPIARKLLALPGYAVTSNGGVTVHLGTGEVLYRHLLSIPVALEIVRAIVDIGSEPYVYEDSDVPGIEGARVLYHPDLPTGLWADRPRYRPHPAIMEELPFAPVSVSAFGPPSRMRPLADRMREKLSSAVSIVESGTDRNWGVEVYARGVSKQLGLERVAARLDVAREEVMAIGDHINDLEMLRWAGVGVAMGNAIPEILEAADWVTTKLTEDGVARAIERFVL